MHNGQIKRFRAICRAKVEAAMTYLAKVLSAVKITKLCLYSVIFNKLL